VNSRMITAELLRIRKNRPLWIWAVIMTTGAVAAFYLIAQGFHLDQPHSNGPAGGADNMHPGLAIISLLGGVAAAIVGTSVGTSDLTAGVFRDLVVTGRSRWSLFAAKLPGALLFWLPLILVSFLAVVGFDFLFAGNLSTPGLTQIVKDGGWALLVTSISLCVSVGVAAVIGSRGISIGVLLGWELAATPLLLNIHTLGVTREILLGAAVRRIQPFTSDQNGVSMSLAAAVLVLALWVAVPLAAGAWRMASRDV
jgi:ABC-type transport system involved in multi-copper enzyme maturation permease subunit